MKRFNAWPVLIAAILTQVTFWTLVHHSDIAALQRRVIELQRANHIMHLEAAK